jgi:hypothetical protein
MNKNQIIKTNQRFLRIQWFLKNKANLLVLQTEFGDKYSQNKANPWTMLKTSFAAE